MRRLIASEFVTLDGVMEAPGHEPHPDDRNAWALRHAGEDQQRFKVDEVFQAGAILLGRVTYEIFAAFWPTAPKDEGFADRMNDIPKSGVTVLTYRPADLAPSSRYVERFAWTGEVMRSWQAAQDAERVLATILFTDIVRSTERAAAIETSGGDACWTGTTRSPAGRSAASVVDS